jgi:hypothetical protein
LISEEVMTDASFQRFLHENSILVGVVVDIARGSIVIHGDPEKLESDGLLRYYFSDAAALTGYLSDRIMPTMLQQGKVAGVVSKPTDDTIVGMLYHDERPVVQRYHHSQLLDQALRTTWQEDSKTA